FGWGRNTFIPFEDQTKDNVLRRIWLRWDGYPDGAGATCPGPTVQTQYHTHHSNDIYENFINIFSGGLYKSLYSGPGDSNHMNGYPCNGLGAGWVTRTGMLDGVAGPSWIGQIIYGYSTNNDIIGNSEGIGMRSRYTAMRIADAFVDGRWSRLDNTNFNIYACDVADPADNNLAIAGSCSQLFIDRVTSVINPGQSTGALGPSGANLSNIHECTSLGSCPSFYTGDGPSTGSRACFEYANGTLTSTPLWPWRMDDRIKQAISRSGIGPTLSGTAGTGYGANTVTSENVSRYGAVPSQCLRGGVSPLAPSITSALTRSGVAGTAFSYQITATNTPTSYGATGLPAGLTVNTTTGLISGTPTGASTPSVTLSATNANGTGTAVLLFTITNPGGPPLAWWKFDEGSGTTALDSAAGAAPPLSLRALTLEAGRIGPFALKCDGIGGYGEQATPFAIDTNQYTVMSWMKGPGAPGTAFDIVFKNGVDSETWGFAWGHPDPNAQQAWWHRLPDGYYVQGKLTTPLLGNTWYHIAVTYDGTSLRAYLNGALQVTTPASTPIAPAGTFRVCRGGGVGTFAGLIDQGKVWNRALSDTEVAQEAATPVSAPRRRKLIQP